MIVCVYVCVSLFSKFLNWFSGNVNNVFAFGLVIAKRRIGLSAALVQRYITNMDLDGLCAEHVELLLKFIPTKDEVRKHRLHKSEQRFVQLDKQTNELSRGWTD